MGFCPGVLSKKVSIHTARSVLPGVRGAFDVHHLAQERFDLGDAL